MTVPQLELGLVVAEFRINRLPVLLDMAACAILAEIGLVLVVLFVAAEAILWSFLEHGALVAFLAFHFDVLTKKRKLGLLVIEFRTLFPRFLDVATCTVLAQCSLVLVVLLVTRDALLAQLVLVKVAGVASLAFGRFVLTQQGVLRVRIVLEGRRLKCLCCVAGVALFTELTLVTLLLVDLLVAGVAVFWSLFVDVVLVAVSALGVHVLSGKRELGCIVIELSLFPARFGMAVSALRTQRSFVTLGVVVLLVAHTALKRRLTPLLS